MVLVAVRHRGATRRRHPFSSAWPRCRTSLGRDGRVAAGGLGRRLAASSHASLADQLALMLASHPNDEVSVEREHHDRSFVSVASVAMEVEPGVPPSPNQTGAVGLGGRK
jgi:hypothetical protein